MRKNILERIVYSFMIILSVITLTSCDGGSSTSNGISSVTLYSTEGGSIAKNTTLQLTLKATYEDGSTQNIANGGGIIYSGYDTSIISVDNNTGVVTGIGAGSTTIMATYNGIKSNPITVEVTNATLTSITINASLPKIGIGTSTLLTATGHFNDNTNQDITSIVTFNADNGGVLSFVAGDATNVGSQYVIATGSSVNTTSVTATLAGVTSNSVPVQVTDATVANISVSTAQGDLVVAKGFGVLLVVKAEMSDGTTQPLYLGNVFTSSKTNVATVDSRGVVSALAAGTATITATYGASTNVAKSNKILREASTSVDITVTDASIKSLVINPSAIDMHNGTSKQLDVTALMTDGTTEDVTTQAIYTSQNSLVHVGHDGVLTADSVGSDIVTASFANLSTTVNVTVDSATLTGITLTDADGITTLPAGVYSQLKVMATYSDGSTQDVTLDGDTTYVSNTPDLMSVNFWGVVHAVAKGDATITATYHGKSSPISFTVNEHVLQSIDIYVADSYVSNYSIAKGTATSVSAIGTYSDGVNQDITSQVLFNFTNSISSISYGFGSSALIYGNSVGNAVLSASFGGVTSNSIDFSVTDATITGITLSSENGTSLPKGVEAQLLVTANFSDGSEQKVPNDSPDISYQTSNSAVMSVSNTGLVKSLSGDNQSADITVKYLTKSSSMSFTSNEHQLLDFFVSVNKSSIAKGTSTIVTAMAGYTDSIKDVSSQVTFTADNANVSFASGGENTLVIGNAVGTSNISATFNGVPSSTSPAINVTAATVEGIEVTGNNTIPMGTSIKLKAELIMSDGTTGQAPVNPVWRSSSGNVVVDNSGEVTLNNATIGSTANITVTANGKTSAPFQVTVTNATLQNVYIKIDNQDGNDLILPLYMKDGHTAVYLAEVWGNFSDGSKEFINVRPDWQYDKTKGFFSVEGNTCLTYKAGGPVNLTATVTDPRIPGGSMTTPTVRVSIIQNTP